MPSGPDIFRRYLAAILCAAGAATLALYALATDGWNTPPSIFASLLLLALLSLILSLHAAGLVKGGRPLHENSRSKDDSAGT